MSSSNIFIDMVEIIYFYSYLILIPTTTPILERMEVSDIRLIEIDHIKSCAERYRVGP